MANRYTPLSERFWGRVTRSSQCWEWTGCRAEAGGYGRIRLDGRQLLAHRVAYELAVGPIAGDLTIDHLCGNKGCVRPEHLELVSRGENARRWTRQITECPQGHPYDEVNTRISRGKRTCRACERVRPSRVATVRRAIVGEASS